MTPEFDMYYESLVREIFNAKSKRQEQKSRYWGNGMYPKDFQPRAVRPMSSSATPSQLTKLELGPPQYGGNALHADGIRKNKSRKTPHEIAIARGNGGHIRIDGVNPKTPGATYNSKGNMEVKYNLANGVSRVGAKVNKNYFKDGTQMKFMKDK